MTKTGKLTMLSLNIYDKLSYLKENNIGCKYFVDNTFFVKLINIRKDDMTTIYHFVKVNDTTDIISTLNEIPSNFVAVGKDIELIDVINYIRLSKFDAIFYEKDLLKLWDMRHNKLDDQKLDVINLLMKVNKLT